MSDTSLSSASEPTAIVGYVEGRSSQEIVGWTWRPGSPERLKVELRFGEEVIATTMADGSREDLRRNGVGDGCHAFRLSMPTGKLADYAATRLFAVDADQIAVELGERPADIPQNNDFAKIQRGLDLLLGSQRVLHRNVQSALLKQDPSLNDALTDISSAQQRLAAAITTVETFAIRIELMLGKRELSSFGEKEPDRFKTKLLTVVSLFGFGVSCVALWRSL